MDLSFYSEIRPLDIIAFKGTDLISNLVGIFEKIGAGNADFTHISVVVSKELIDDIKDDQLWLFESTVSDARKISSYGVQLRPLNSVMTAYQKSDPGCRVAWLKLKNNPLDTDRVNVVARFRASFEAYKNLMYDVVPCSLIGAVFKRFRRSRDVFQKIVLEGEEFLSTVTNKKFSSVNDFMFCSELIAMIYKDIGVFGPDVEANSFMPTDLLKNVDVDGVSIVVEEPRYLL